MTTMLDKAAAAICAKIEGRCDVWQDLSAGERDGYKDLVYAALKAIREPERQAVTCGMVAIMTDDLQPTGDEVSAGFTAMIDAILGGKA